MPKNIIFVKQKHRQIPMNVEHIPDCLSGSVKPSITV